jgi:hypothetical protein
VIVLIFANFGFMHLVPSCIEATAEDWKNKNKEMREQTESIEVEL